MRKVFFLPRGKIAETAVCRLTTWHCILRAELTKTQVPSDCFSGLLSSRCLQHMKVIGCVTSNDLVFSPPGLF